MEAMVDKTIKDLQKLKDDDPNNILILKDRRHIKNTVLNHPDIKEIEHRLIQGERVEDVAKEYGLSKAALYRYKSKYLALKIARVLMSEKKAEIISGEALTFDLITLRDKIHNALEEIEKVKAEAKSKGDKSYSYLRLATFRELARVIQIQIDIAAEIRERQKLNILEANKDWDDHKKILIQVFRQYPEAKQEYIKLAQSIGAVTDIRR